MLKDKIIKYADYLIGACIIAVAFFTPLIFDYSLKTYNFFDIYKIIFFRSAVTLMLLAYVAKVFIGGRVSFRGRGKIFLFAFFLSASFFISSLFSSHPAQSFWGSFNRQQGFYNFFNYVLFFCLLILNVKNLKQIKLIVWATVASAALTALYGLAQFVRLDPFLWSNFGVSGSRIFSTLGQPNFYGHYLIMALPLSFYALVFMARRFWLRFFLALAVLAQLACLVFTYSRAAWLGLAGGGLLALAVWLYNRRFDKTAWRRAGVILIALAAIITLNLAVSSNTGYLGSVNLADRLKNIANFKTGSGKMRLYYFQSGWAEFKSESSLRRILGNGPEVLGEVMAKYYRTDWGVYEDVNSYPDRLHNWPLDQLLALGILGLAATLVFYGYFVYRAGGYFLSVKKFDEQDWLLLALFAALAGYSINNLFSFSLVANFIYLFLILGMAWLIINFKEKQTDLDIRLTAFSKITITLALLAVAAIFIYTNNINQARAEMAYVRAVKASKSGDCNGMIDDMEKVFTWNPNSGYYQEKYLFLTVNCLPAALDLESRRNLSQNMLSLINQIKDKNFKNLRLSIERAYAMAGLYLDDAYYGLAEKMYLDDLDAYPYLTFAYEDLGRQKMMVKDYAGAVKIFKQEELILPPLNHPDLDDQHRRVIEAVLLRLYENLGQAYLSAKNFTESAAYYEKALKINPLRVTLYKNLADAYYLQGQLDQVIVLNKRGQMLSPADYHWPMQLSLLYREKKDMARARKYLEDALKLAPENEELKQYEKEINK